MNIETLQKEMIVAMKNKDKIRKDTISSLVSAVKKAAIDNKCKDDITEKLVDQVLLKEEKTMQEMIDTCPVDRADTLNEYNQKLTIIKEFTPVLIANADEIEEMVKNIGRSRRPGNGDRKRSHRGGLRSCDPGPRRWGNPAGYRPASAPPRCRTDL